MADLKIKFSTIKRFSENVVLYYFADSDSDSINYVGTIGDENQGGNSDETVKFLDELRAEPNGRAALDIQMGLNFEVHHGLIENMDGEHGNWKTCKKYLKARGMAYFDTHRLLTIQLN